MGLRLAGGVNGLENKITSPRIQKLGLALAGYTDYLHSGRMQFIGRTEGNYFKTLDDEGRSEAIRRIFDLHLCGIMVTGGQDPPIELLECARQYSVPVLLTGSLSSRAIDEISEYLEDCLAPSTTIHAVMMEVFGMGVLVVGGSGIGKSECALELILRGHRLVSDDHVVVRRLGTDRLVGSGPDYLRFHMELRGIGIINIKDLFGISSVSIQKPVDLAVELVRWDERPDHDRIGLEEQHYEMLGAAVPLIRLPVASGRNVATLVEVAVRIYMLRKQGYRPEVAFIKELERRLRDQSSAEE